MDRLSAAKEAWQNNLTNAPVRQQREAILKIAETPARPVLSAERVALNFAQRLSGIARTASSWVKSAMNAVMTCCKR